MEIFVQIIHKPLKQHPSSTDIVILLLRFVDYKLCAKIYFFRLSQSLAALYL